MLSVWKKANNGLEIPQSQLRGLIIVCLLMVVIPFLHFFYLLQMPQRLPPYLEDGQNRQAIELVDESGRSEIYFVKSKAELDDALKRAGGAEIDTSDLMLRDGLKFFIDGHRQQNEAVDGEMEAAKKLALGMPLDINRASKEDLMLINGIGEKTAEKIIALRQRLGGFSHVEQLMQIKGIKEKRFAKLKPYLYVGKNRS